MSAWARAKGQGLKCPGLDTWLKSRSTAGAWVYARTISDALAASMAREALRMLQT